MSDQKGNDDNARDKSRDTASDQGSGRTRGQTSGDAGGKTASGQSATPRTSSSAAGKDTGASGTKAQSGASGRTTSPGAAKPAPAPPAARDTGRDKSPGGGGRGPGMLAIGALLVALIALVVAGWLWYRGEQRLAAFSDRIDTVEVALQSNVQDVVMPRLSQLQSRVEDLAGTNAEQRQALAAVQEELEDTQLQLSGMAQRLEGAERRWQLMQIEDLLLTANRRLQLYEDPADARAALKLASEAVARMNDPRLFEVRNRIINGIAALDALPDPDIEGLALTLSALIEQVPELPLASDVPEEYQPEPGQEGGQGDGQNGGQADGPGIDLSDLSSGWRHFVDSVGEALQSMVTIRRADGTQRALLPPDQVYFLTQNLILELRSARLALLKGNSEAYRTSLSTAIDWLQRYYATDDPAVAAMIDRLRQMQNVKLDWQPPDISGSLAALRDYMAARSQAQGGGQGQGSQRTAGPDGAAQAGSGDTGSGQAAAADNDSATPGAGQGSE